MNQPDLRQLPTDVKSQDMALRDFETWHSYEPTPEIKSIEKFFEVVSRDQFSGFRC